MLPSVFRLLPSPVQLEAAAVGGTFETKRVLQVRESLALKAGSRAETAQVTLLGGLSLFQEMALIPPKRHKWDRLWQHTLATGQ